MSLQAQQRLMALAKCTGSGIHTQPTQMTSDPKTLLEAGMHSKISTFSRTCQTWVVKGLEKKKNTIVIEKKNFLRQGFFVLPWTQFVNWAGLKLRNPPASASQVLGLKMCTIPPSSAKLFKNLFYMCGWFCLTMSVYHVHAVPKGTRGWVGSPGTRIQTV